MKSHAYGQLSPEELQNWLAVKKNILLIDTLPADHFRGVHLPGSANACVFEVDFMAQLVSSSILGCIRSLIGSALR